MFLDVIAVPKDLFSKVDQEDELDEGAVNQNGDVGQPLRTEGPRGENPKFRKNSTKSIKKKRVRIMF